MSVAGGCAICQSGDVSGTCRRCGNLACERHYDAEYDLCTECVVEVGGGETGHSQKGEYPDGVGEYRF
ncbi:hypothetical protein VB773_09835 [Haloarculaceae archaeon H-GB2-1]|nr:hypothetical protein [Haloarculaceae archaeon H-GB1-1]MEA5386332.1 hypothetical protein [Haloarculaceae archaeon H-GB11]MEA5407834.1 hypothetical protein [Haloarculaceae archaeon H-GB2-1]